MDQHNKEILRFSLRTFGIFLGSVAALYILIHIFLYMFTLIELARSANYLVLYEAKGGESVEAFTQGLDDISQDDAFFTSLAVQSRQYRQARRLRKGISDSYESEYWWYHDSIVDRLQQMNGFLELSEQEFIGPVETYSKFVDEKREYISQTEYLTLHDLKDLNTQVQTMSNALANQVHKRERYMAYGDVLGLKNHIAAAHDFYRLRYRYSEEKNTLRDFLDDFLQEFTREYLTTATPDEIEKKARDMQVGIDDVLLAYHAEKNEEREKRAPMVQAEKEKWEGIDQTPPTAPYPNRFKQIYINLQDQYMYAYEDGELIMSTPITSGRRDYDTVRGTFSIYTKQRGKYLESPFTDDPNDPEYYRLWVDYWIPFYGGYGIHDACNSKSCWRTEFGGTSYRWAGSHGCVNTPYDKVAFIYDWAPVGTTVYVN